MFHFTDHLLILARTSSRTKTFFHQDLLNPGKGKSVPAESQGTEKQGFEPLFKDFWVFFTPQSADHVKIKKNLSYVFLTLSALLR